ncbi:MAG: FtsX-like permease family protein [Myxococcales bacterium FL481]|nr:MAG: FtsX-like permease family protein [Myxococcales bacterium FL481]
MARTFFVAWYVLVRGLRGMVQSPAVQFLAIGTMAVCMLLLCTVLLVFSNATRVADNWGVDIPLTVYLEADTEPEEAMTLAEQIRARPEVSRAEWIDAEAAAARLEASLGRVAGSFDELAGTVLPHTVEVHLQPGVAAGAGDELAAQLETVPHIEEVARLGPWVDQANRLVSTTQALAWGLGALVSVACTMIAWSMIRLAVFARRAEIEILRMVGGTVAFVRAPFVVEGVLSGVFGAALALGVLHATFQQLGPILEQGLSLLFLAGTMQFFSPLEMGGLVACGAVFGALGSRAAVGHHVAV